MKEIVERLHENRQIELAKSILESNGYKVSKRVSETKKPPTSFKKGFHKGQYWWTISAGSTVVLYDAQGNKLGEYSSVEDAKADGHVLEESKGYKVSKMKESEDSRVCIWGEGSKDTEVLIYRSGDSDYTYEIEIKDRGTDNLDTSLMDEYDLSGKVFDDRREAVTLAYDILDDLTNTYPKDGDYKEELDRLLSLLNEAGVDLGRNRETTAGSPYRDEDCPNDVLHKVVLLLPKNGYTKSYSNRYGANRTHSQVSYRKRVGNRDLGVTIRRDSKSESGMLYVDR